jgi:hypothetical protein
VRPSPARLGHAAIGLTILSLAVLCTWHSRAYFFVFDDFAVVGEAWSLPLADIVRLPVFGVYRPMVLLVTRLQYAAFHWSMPAGYIAGSLVVHGLNGALLYGLVRQLREDRDTALLAGALFLISPWSAEAYFWLSGRYDLLVTSGALAAWLLGLIAVRSSRSSVAVAAAALGCLAAAMGLLAKEIAVTIPAVFVAILVTTDRPRDALTRRSLLYLGCHAVLVALYLLMRARVLPGLGSAYGDLPTLFRNGAVMHNLWTYVRACVLLPFPDGPTFGDISLGTVATASFACLVAGTTWLAARARVRLVLLVIIGFLSAIAPVAWVGLPLDSYGSGRYLYLAGAWFSLLLALGLRRVQWWAETHPSPRASAAYLLSLTAAIAAPLAAITYQAVIWQEAFRLARTTMDQVRPYVNGNADIFVPNLPFWFGEGPYVLKGYAFTYYFNPSNHVRVRAMALRYLKGESWFAGWVDDPDAGAPVPGPNERSVTLQLPVKHLEPDPRGAIEVPAPDAVVAQPFVMSGWAIDAVSPQGPGVDIIHVYAYPDPPSDRPPIFIDVATYGGRRADIAAKFGSPFKRSGWKVSVAGLPAGSYRLAALPHDRMAGAFTGAIAVTVTVK